MKHLKSIFLFNKPELPNEVIQTIRDICLDLNDLGFKVFTNQLGFNKLGKREGFYPNITIFRDPLSTPDDQRKYYFEFDEVKEIVDRIKNYMTSNGYKVKIDKAMDEKVLKEINIKFI